MLRRESLRVGALKSCHHPIDAASKEKDSWKLKGAGAERVATLEKNMSFSDVLPHFATSDIILVEGGRRLNLPAFLLPGWHKDPTWQRPTRIIADLNDSPSPLSEALKHIIGQLKETRD